MSNDEQPPLQIAPKAQQQRRSRRLVIGGSMTKTRPKQASASANVDNQHQRNNSDNEIGSQINAPDQANDNNNNSNNNNNDSNASTSETAAATTNTTSIASSSTTNLPASTATANKQNKLRVRMVRRSNEPAEEDIRLMKLIKVYPFLYDKTDSAYGKKKTSWETWETISKAMKLPVFTCKERWRNIRAAFMRSIDYYKTQNGPNRSKQYYMNEELAFLKNCVDKQKRAGIAADNDSSSNDADDSEHGKNNFLLPAAITKMNNTTISTLPETREVVTKQSQLKSLTSEIATTSNGQMVLQNNASTIVSVTTAPSVACNGVAMATLSALSQPPSSSSSQPSSSSSSTSTSTPQIPMQQISLPIPFQLPTTSTPKSSPAEQLETITNATTEMITPPPAKRRRYYEYDEKTDTFKRVQLQNIFDGWSEQDSDAHFLKSLFLKMRNLTEDQSLRFQCKTINALREVQLSATTLTPKTSTTLTTSTPVSTSQQLQQNNAGSTTLRLDHLNEEQRSHIQRYIQHITNDTTSTTINQQQQQQRSTNLLNGTSSTDNLLTPTRRFDLAPMVMPLLIKDELLDTGHLSN